jgi:phosphoribosylanthranilate isomerase
MTMPVAPAIKFCGMTRTEDVVEAVRLRVDFIGLVFAEGSPRKISVEEGRKLVEIAHRAAPAPRIVALLRNASPAFIEKIIAALAPDLLQFHGSERADACERFGLPYWKAIGMAGHTDAGFDATTHPRADALLLDAHEPGAAGGTGEKFDWRCWPRTDRRLVLAGGLRPDNVATAIAATRPYAVDVSSGIESAPGIKDLARMRAFVAAVRSEPR